MWPPCAGCRRSEICCRLILQGRTMKRDNDIPGWLTRAVSLSRPPLEALALVRFDMILQAAKRWRGSLCGEGKKR